MVNSIDFGMSHQSRPQVGSCGGLTSAIKFPLDKPVPVQMISEMAAYRAKENLERASKKGTKK